MGFSFFVSMILGLMDVKFSHSLSFSLSQSSNFQGGFLMWIKKCLLSRIFGRSVGALCCANSFLVLGNENGVVSLGRFGGFREMKGKTNHAVYPLVRNLTIMS